jgi:hypothetical protein
MKTKCLFCADKGIIKTNKGIKRCDCVDKVYRVYESNSLKNFKRYLTTINGTFEDVINKLAKLISARNISFKVIDHNKWYFFIPNSEIGLLIEEK